MRVLILSAEALNLAYLGCYGNEWVATPTLDRLAAEGIVFDRHFVDCPTALRTAWTGRYAFPDGPSSADMSAELPALLAAHDIPFFHVSAAGARAAPTEAETLLERVLEGVLEAVATAETADSWLIWVDLPGLLPPWVVPQPLLDRYFAEQAAAEPAGPDDEEEALEPLTPLTDPPEGP